MISNCNPRRLNSCFFSPPYCIPPQTCACAPPPKVRSCLANCKPQAHAQGGQ
ncbi:hypothetical protein BC567DRAFT_239565 [Phyllosticta citribraziliensis]